MSFKATWTENALQCLKINIISEINYGTITVTGFILVSLKPVGFVYKSVFSK